MSQTNEDLKAKLKAEGNALFAGQQYEKASAKYTEGLKLEPTNAILYSNRAACRLNLKQYMDAASDAETATQLDPNYARAFARLATAWDYMHSPSASVVAWRRAVEILGGKDTLTDGERSQKTEYESCLKIAMNAVEKLKVPAEPKEYSKITLDGQIEQKLPWVIACQRLPYYLQMGKFDSSIGVIYGAYQDLSIGMKKLKEVRRKGNVISGWIGVVSDLSNCILEDPRVFHIRPEMSEITNLWSLQVEHEFTHNEIIPWSKHGPDVIKKEALKLLKEKGWEATRPALACVVRARVFSGFLLSSLHGEYEPHVEMTSNAVEIISWMRETFPNVAESERGIITSRTFYRGVQNLLLEALGGLYHTDASDKPAILERIHQQCRWIINDVDNDVCPPLDGESRVALSFFRYPKSNAHAMLGFYYHRTAINLPPEEQHPLNLKASEAYMEAAKLLPEDDLNHTWYYAVAVDHMRLSGQVPVRMILEAVRNVRTSLPKMMEIWSLRAQRKEEARPLMANVSYIAKDVEAKVANGSLSIGSSISLAHFVINDVGKIVSG